VPIRWTTRRTPIIGLIGTLFVLQSATCSAEPCRIEWEKYKKLSECCGRHKAFAAQRTPHYPGYCFWWHDADSVEAAISRALQNCNSWQADTCDVVDVDGAPRRAGLDRYFAQSQYVPASIEIYDKPSDKKETLQGFVLIDYPAEGDIVQVRLVSGAKKTICTGSYMQPQLWSLSLTVSGVCFNHYRFQNALNITGFRYVDGLKIGPSFEGTFSYSGSYVHIVSK
jgi:hypothetical protein